MSVLLTSVIINEYLNWLIDFRNVKPQTIDTNKKRLSYLAQYLKNKPFNQENCLQYLIYLRETGKSPATRALSKSAMRSFCLFLATKDPSFQDFTLKLPKIKIPEYAVEPLTNEEVRAIIECKRKYRYKGLQEFWDTLISLIARTGRRISDVRTIKVKDINVTQSALLIRDPKNSQPRWLPIPKDLINRMLLLGKGKDPEHYIFVHDFSNGTPVSGTAIRKECKKRADLSGITRANPHRFRHSFPIELLRMKVPLPFVQRLMGHKQTSSTLRYIHMVLDDLRIASAAHPLNQAELAVLDIIEGIEKDLKRYSLSKREDLEFDLQHKQREFYFRIKW